MPTLQTVKRPNPHELILQHAQRLLPHLRIAVPAIFGVWCAAKAVRSRGRQQSSSAEEREGTEEGTPVEISFPTKQPASLPVLPAPTPLKTLLIDITLPMPIAQAWTNLFSNSSSLLSDFHYSLGDVNISESSWKQLGDKKFRTLTYTTPLSNPIGPKTAGNHEVLTILAMSPTLFVLQTRCVTEGVPFSGNFANYLQWSVTSCAKNACLLKVSAETRFHSPVWGPLKGKIEGESMKGIQKAYLKLENMLTTMFRANKVHISAITEKPTHTKGAVQLGPQSNPAVMLFVAMLLVLVWRMVLFDGLTLAALHKFSGQQQENSKGW